MGKKIDFEQIAIMADMGEGKYRRGAFVPL